MVCLLLSTLISYVNVKLNVFKFEEELFFEISTLEDEAAVCCRARLAQQCEYYILNTLCNSLFRPTNTATIRESLTNLISR